MSAPYRFDRYRNGRLMAEGIKVNKENCLEDAIKVAARLADHGDVLVYDVAIDAALAEIGEPAPSVREAARVLCGSAETPFLEPASAITRELRNHGYLVPVRTIHKVLRAIAEGKDDE